MKKLIELKCPSCGNSLEIDEGREISYCQYCGTKILINDENKYTYHHIDDAEIKRAETEQMVRLKEIELEGKEQSGRKALIILWITVTLLMFFIGVLMISTGPKDENDPGYFLMMFAMLVGFGGGLGLFTVKGKDKRKSITQNGIKITSAVANAQGKNYESLAAIVKGLGFKNITCIPMKDLNIFTARKNGLVESITINGDENVSEGDIFSDNSLVTITYHSHG